MTAARRPIAQAAIDATLAGLAPEDEASVVIFAGFVGLGLPWTPAQRVPPLAWEQWKPAECTRLFDAIEVALGLIDRSRNPRPVLLLVSDGGENSSDLKFEEIVRTRRQSETLTYAYRPGSLDTGRRGFDEVMPSNPSNAAGAQPTFPLSPNAAALSPDFLPELVGDSGGTVLPVRALTTAPDTVRAFLDELNAQYTLGYVPKKASDGKYRKLKVEAKSKDLRVRHRGGYLAMPRDSGPGLQPVAGSLKPEA